MFERIKNHFKKIKELKSYSFGDVINCKIDHYGYFNFKENHQIRPILFIGYYKKRIYGYTFTHAKQEDNVLKISKIFKDSDSTLLLSCLFVLKSKSYESFNTKLSDKESNVIAKTLLKMQDSSYLYNEIFKHITPSENDIVLYNNKKYIVYANDSNNFTIYPILDNKTDYSYSISNPKYSLNLEIEIKPILTDIKNIIYFETLPFDARVQIKNYKNDFKNKNKTLIKTHLAIGDLYKSNNGTFLVLSIMDDYMVVTKPNTNYPTFIKQRLVDKKPFDHYSNERVNKIKNECKKNTR